MTDHVLTATELTSLRDALEVAHDEYERRALLADALSQTEAEFVHRMNRNATSELLHTLQGRAVVLSNADDVDDDGDSAPVFAAGHGHHADDISPRQW